MQSHSWSPSPPPAGISPRALSSIASVYATFPLLLCTPLYDYISVSLSWRQCAQTRARPSRYHRQHRQSLSSETPAVHVDSRSSMEKHPLPFQYLISLNVETSTSSPPPRFGMSIHVAVSHAPLPPAIRLVPPRHLLRSSRSCRNHTTLASRPSVQTNSVS